MRKIREYILTKTSYERLLGRGFYLVCRKCEMPIRPSHEKNLATGRAVPVKIVSKSSKYRQWQCLGCGFKFGKSKPKDICKCPMCNGEGPERTTTSGKRKQEPIIKDIGRKFYCQNCYNSTVTDIPNDILNGEVSVRGLFYGY